MRVRTEAVDIRDVQNSVIVAAHYLWVAYISVTSINEDSPGNVADAHLMKDYATQFGPWEERLRKAREALKAFYGIWYGEEGEALIEEYFDAQRKARFYDPVHPSTLRFQEASRALVAFHNGYIVAGRTLRKATDESVAEDELDLYAIEV